MLRAKGQLEVLERVNENAYKVDLPGDNSILATFNMTDLSPYLQDNCLANLRMKSSQQGEDNEVP